MPNLTTSLLSALGIVVFRGVPFLFYVVVSKRVAWIGKALTLIVALAVIYWLNRVGVRASATAVSASLAMWYFFVLALGVYWLRDVYANGRLSKLVLFALCAVAYTLLPALFAPGPLANQMVVLGFEVMLASYSYCLDTSEQDERPGLRDCLFFLLVNPTIIYEQRGERFGDPRLDVKGIARCCMGVAALVVRGFCLVVLATVSSGIPALSEWDANTLTFLATYYLSVYAAHSALASIQIGLMRLIGHRVPERYRYPFVATSPLDFWQRWNIWLGHWLQRYIFYPVSLHIARSTGWISGAAKPMGVAATFLAIGALHDWTVYIRHVTTAADHISFGYTVLFFVCAVELLLWAGAARAIGVLGFGRRPWRGMRIGVMTLCIALMYVLELANGGVVVPALSGQGIQW